METYRYITPERVLTGAGARKQVAEQARALGCERAFLLTTASLQRHGELVEEIESELVDLWAGTFAGCSQHSPARTVEAAVQAARDAGADALVSLGGGSVTDTCKAVALRMAELNGGSEPPPQLAVPTTLSAGEFTPVAGITDEHTQRKGLRFDPRIIPRVVLLDPEATLFTPRELWLSTGVKALDHALETIWSRHPHPVSETLALEAVRRLVRHLPPSASADDISARAECQMAAWMSIFGMLSTGVRLSHPLGHQIGALWNVPHGITSCIVLAPVMRFLAPRCLPAQLRIAEALGVPVRGRAAATVAAEAADELERFIQSLHVTMRLQDTFARRGEIPAVAVAVLDELTMLAARDDVEGGAEALERLIESMW